MKKRILVRALVFVAVAMVGAGVFALARWRAERSLDAALQSSDIQVMYEGSLGEALFTGAAPGHPMVVQGTGMKALLAPSKEPPRPGLIQAYEQNPRKFQRYAKLFETYLNALKLGQRVRQQKDQYQLPVASSNLRVPPDQKLDAWGHPYCISNVGESIAVVSGGPGASSFSCAQQRTSSREIAAASRTVFQTSQGEVVFVLEPDALIRSKTKR